MEKLTVKIDEMDWVIWGDKTKQGFTITKVLHNGHNIEPYLSLATLQDLEDGVLEKIK